MAVDALSWQWMLGRLERIRLHTQLHLHQHQQQEQSLSTATTEPVSHTLSQLQATLSAMSQFTQDVVEGFGDFYSRVWKVGLRMCRDSLGLHPLRHPGQYPGHTACNGDPHHDAHGAQSLVAFPAAAGGGGW